MSNTFNTVKLAGDRTLVRGEDEVGLSYQVILDAREFNELAQRDAARNAAESFDAAVEQFFAPLTEAADELSNALSKQVDPAFFIVEQEAERGVAPRREVLRHLQKDTVVLRMIASGNTSRLIWVDTDNGSSIEILDRDAVATEAPEPEVTDVTVPQPDEA